jgi:drug/metabolite transporter (DMT)-like permease
MSFEEKVNWVYGAVAIGVFGVYFASILGQARNTAVAEIAFQQPMLIAIGVAVAANILGAILVSISKPSEADKSDARDKEINRFGEYVGGAVLGVGMVLPLGLTLAEADHFWIANAMLAAFVLSALVSTIVKLVAYRRGL